MYLTKLSLTDWNCIHLSDFKDGFADFLEQLLSIWLFWPSSWVHLFHVMFPPDGFISNGTNGGGKWWWCSFAGRHLPVSRSCFSHLMLNPISISWPRIFSSSSSSSIAIVPPLFAVCDKSSGRRQSWEKNKSDTSRTKTCPKLRKSHYGQSFEANFLVLQILSCRV